MRGGFSVLVITVLALLVISGSAYALGISLTVDSSYTLGENVTISGVLEDNGTGIHNNSVSYTIKYGSTMFQDATNTSEEAGNGSFYIEFEPPEVNEYTVTATASYDGSSTIAQTKFSVSEVYNYDVVTKPVYSVGEQITVKTKITNSTGDPVSGEGVDASLLDENGTVLSQDSDSTNANGEATSTFSSQNTGKYFIDINGVVSRIIKVKSYDMIVDITDSQGISKGVFSPDENITLIVKLLSANKNPINDTVADVYYRIAHRNGTAVQADTILSESGSDTGIYETSDIMVPAGEYVIEIKAEALGVTQRERIKFRAQGYFIQTIAVSVKDDKYPERPHDVFGPGKNVTIGVVIYDVANDEFETAYDVDIVLRKFGDWVPQPVTHTKYGPFEIEGMNVTVLEFPSPVDGEYIAELKFNISDAIIYEGAYFRIESLFAYLGTTDKSGKFRFTFSPKEDVYLNIKLINASTGNEITVTDVSLKEMRDDNWNDITGMIMFNNSNPNSTYLEAPNETGHYYVRALVNGQASADSWFEVRAYEIFADSSRWFYSPGEAVVLTATVKDFMGNPVSGTSVDVERIRNEVTNKEYDVGTDVNVEPGFTDSNGEVEIEISPPSGGWSVGHYSVELVSKGEYGWTGFEIKQFVTHVELFSGSGLDEHQDIFGSASDLKLRVFANDLNKKPINVESEIMGVMYQGTDKNPLWPPRKVNVTLPSKFNTTSSYGDGISDLKIINHPAGGWKQGNYFILARSEYSGQEDFARRHFGIKAYYLKLKPELNDIVHDPVFQPTETFNTTVTLIDTSGGTYGNPVNITLVGIHDIMLDSRLYREDDLTSFKWTDVNNEDNISIDLSSLSDLHAGEYWFDFRAESVDGEIYSGMWLVVTPFIPSGWDEFEDRPTDYFGDFLPGENVTGKVYVMYPNGTAASGVDVTVVKLMHFMKKDINITDAAGMVVGGKNTTGADGKTTVTLASPGDWKGGFYKAILRAWKGDDEIVLPEWASPGFSIRSFMIDWSLRDNEHYMPYLPNKTITVDFEVRYPDGTDATNDISIYLPHIIEERDWISHNATDFGQVKYLPDPEHERYSVEFVAPPDLGFYIAQFLINDEEEYHVWFEVMKTPEGDDILESWMWPRAVSMKGLHYGLGIGNKVGNDYPVSNATVSLRYSDILNVPNEWEIFPSPSYFNNTDKMIIWSGVDIGNESEDFHYYAEPGGEPQGIYSFEWNVTYEYDNGSYSLTHKKVKSVPTDVLSSEVLPGLVGESETKEFNLTLTNLGQKGNATNAIIRLWLNREFTDINCSTCDKVEQHPWGDWELIWFESKIVNGTSEAKTYSFAATTPKDDTWIDWNVEYKYSNFEVEHVNWKDISVGDAIEVRVWPGAATPEESEWFSLELRNKLRDRNIKYPRIEIFGLEKVDIKDLEGISVGANTNGSLVQNTTVYERIDSSASVIKEGYITLENGKKKLKIVIWNTTTDDNFIKLGIDWDQDDKVDDIMINGTERHPFSHYPYKVVIAPDGSSAGFESVTAKVGVAPLAGSERNISVVDTDSDGWFDSVYVEDDGTSDYNFTGDGPYEWGKLATVNTTEFWVKEMCRWEGSWVRFIQKSKFDAVNVNATLILPDEIEIDELEGGTYNETSNEIKWTDSIVPSDDDQRFEFKVTLPMTGLDYYNFTYNVTYYTNETGTLQQATPISKTIKVWRDLFESKATPEFCALDGVGVPSCTFTVNITNKYDGNITVKFLDVRMDSVFNVSKSDVDAPSGFTTNDPYYRLERNGDIAFRWDLYDIMGEGDKFVNFTANESKTMNITVNANPELLDQIVDDGRKDYWFDWCMDYQNPQGFEVGHHNHKDLYLGDVLEDNPRVSSLAPGKPHNMFFFEIGNRAWTDEREQAEMSIEDEDRDTECSGFFTSGIVVNENMGEVEGDADPSEWIHPYMYHPMYGNRLENISCNMGGFYCEEEAGGYSPKLANFSIWGHTLYAYIFDSNNNGQAEYDAVFFGKKNETSGEYMILEDMADVNNLGDIFHAPDTELNITTLSDTAFGLTNPYCPNGSETIEGGEYSFVTTDSDSDGSYDTAYIDLDGDGFYNTTDFEKELTAGDKTYFGGNPYYVIDVTSWGDRIFLGKETVSDVTGMNITLTVPDDLKIIYATGGSVTSDTTAKWENLVITSDGWKEFPVVLDLGNITVVPSVYTINWSVNYTFKDTPVTHEGTDKVVVDKDRISVEVVPMYLGENEQKQYELKIKADQGFDVHVSQISMDFGTFQEIPNDEWEKVEDGYGIDSVSPSGCDVVDDDRRIKCDDWRGFPGVDISSGNSWSLDFEATTDDPANVFNTHPQVVYTYPSISPLELELSEDLDVRIGNILRSDFFVQTFLGNQTMYGLHIENPMKIESNVDERYTIGQFPIETSPVPVSSQEIMLFNTNKSNWTRPIELVNNEEDTNVSYKPKQGYVKFDVLNISLYVYDGDDDGLINFTGCYMDFDGDYNLTDNESTAQGPPGAMPCDSPMFSEKLNVSIAADGSYLNATVKFYQEVDNESLAGRLFEIDTDSDMLWDTLNYEGVGNYSFYDVINLGGTDYYWMPNEETGPGSDYDDYILLAEKTDYNVIANVSIDLSENLTNPTDPLVGSVVGNIATFPNLVFPSDFEAGSQAMLVALAMNNTFISWDINYTITGYESEIPSGFWEVTENCTIGLPVESGGCMVMGGGPGGGP